jgi:hypothetical protein
MNNIRKNLIVGFCFLLLTTVSLLWLHAQENVTPNAGESGDKWNQINLNNQEILKSLDTVDENLNFIKARSMRGGRSS